MPIIAPNHFAAVLMMYAALPNEDTRNPHVDSSSSWVQNRDPDHPFERSESDPPF
jgi:hypothetical protein